MVVLLQIPCNCEHKQKKSIPSRPTQTLITPLLVTSHCAPRRKDGRCVLAHTFCISRKGGTGGGGWGHLQGAVHTAAARLGCKRAIEWANSCPGCINRPRKRYSHLLGCLLLTGKAAWALSRYLPTKNPDCLLMSGHG